MINYIKMRITYKTLNKLLENMKQIPLITNDELEYVIQTKDIIEQWIVVYEYNHGAKKRALNRLIEED